MASLWEKRQQQLAKRGQVPKAPSVPPAAGLVEPPQKVAVPAASAVAPAVKPEPAPASSPVPAAPVFAPEKAVAPPPLPAPADVSAAPSARPKSIPPLSVAAPSAPAEEPSAPVEMPGETSSGSMLVGSGDILVEGESPAPRSPWELSPKAPEPAPVSVSPLSSLILPEEVAQEPEAFSAALAAPASARAPRPELKRRESGTLGFKRLTDNGFLPSRYKLTYTGSASASSCNFLLIGKEEHAVTLELDEPKTLTVQTKGGPMALTLTYKGASKEDGTKNVEYVAEGGMSAVTGIFERFRRVGPAAMSAARSFVKHLPEAVTVGFAAGLAACGFTLEWVGAELGMLHPYVTAAVPALMAAMAFWSWAERSKDIRKESEKSE